MVQLNFSGAVIKFIVTYIKFLQNSVYQNGVMGDGGGGRWLVRMEWRPARWSLCLPLLMFPCTIKSRSSLLAPAGPGGPGKRAVKRLCMYVLCIPKVIKNDSFLTELFKN